MKKFRKKPVIIWAAQWEGKSLQDYIDFSAEHNLPDNFGFGCSEGKSGILIYTLEGTMVASRGDYIIKGVKGEFYPCKPDIFEATYEPVR